MSGALSWKSIGTLVDASGIPIPSGMLVAATASVAASLVLAEATDNGSNTQSLRGSATVSSNRIFTLPDVGDGEVLVTTGSQTVDGAKTFNTTPVLTAGVSLSPLFTARTTNAGARIVLAEGTDNGTNTATLAAPASITSNRVFTLPDVADGEVLVATGSQTVSGAKTFSTAPVLSAGVGLSPFLTARTASVGARLVLAEGTDNGTDTVTLQAAASVATPRVFTLPDLPDADVLVATGTQTVTGSKVFAGGLTASGGFGAGSMVVSAEVTGTGGAQQTAHGLGRTPTIFFAFFTELDGNAADIGTVTVDGTNWTVTVTSGQKYKLFGA